jgi:hypothetical protein
MGRTRRYATNADRQKAYHDRRRAELAQLRRQVRELTQALREKEAAPRRTSVRSARRDQFCMP